MQDLMKSSEAHMICTPTKIIVHHLPEDNGGTERFVDYKKKTIIDAGEIEGFVFGGYDSRLWMLKKYINEQPLN